MEKVIIIGGGVAGLSAGIYAQQQGLETHIYEKHIIAGGNLTGWERRGCHIDNCVHWLTGTNPKNGYFEMWKNVGAIDENLVFQPNIFYASELNGQQVALGSDIEKTRKDMLALSPADEKEIDSFIRAVKSAMKMEKILSEKDIVKGEKLGLLPILKYFNTSLDALGKRFKHPLLQKLFSDYIMGDYSAFALIMAYAAFAGGNGGLPVGGSKAMADRMVARYKALGGSLHLGASVSAVKRTENRLTGIILKDGSVINADYIIFACDPYVTYELLGQKMPKGVHKNIAAKKLPVYSSLQCAYVVDSPVMPFDGNLVIECKSTLKMMPERLILREYSHEPSFAPEGKNILQVLIYIHDEDCKYWIDLRNNDRAEYNAEKAALAAECERIIAARFPELKGKINFLDFWTPATYERYYNSHMGAWMGVLMPGRIPLVTKRKVQGYKNAFLATQWLRSPGGLPNALTGGDEAVKDLMKRVYKDRKRFGVLPTANRKRLVTE